MKKCISKASKRVIAVFISALVLLTAITLVDYCFNTRVREQSVNCRFNQFSDAQRKSIFSSLDLHFTDNAQLVSAYIPYGDKTLPNKYVIQTDSFDFMGNAYICCGKERVPSGLKLDDSEKDFDEAYYYSDNGFFRNIWIFSYGGGKYLVIQGEYLWHGDRERIESIGYRLTLNALYGF